MSISQAEYLKLAETLEKLEKSINAIGYPHADQGGRTGLSALARMALDPVMHSIAAQDRDFRLIKEIKKEKATSSVHIYKVNTSVATQGLDLAGIENFMPHEDAAQYETCTEMLKVYGLRKSLSEFAMLISEAGGLEVDADKENEITAIKALSATFERHGYAGGDFFLNPVDGSIDFMAPLGVYGRNAVPAVREARGIQSNVRQGNNASRGVSGDFEAYGNSLSTLADLRGQAMDQDAIDDMVTAIRENGQGIAREAHCQAVQATEFRKQLFPVQRGDIGTKFSVQGPDVSADDDGFSVLSATGPLKFLPCLYKHSMRQKARPVNGTAGVAPVMPTVSAQASVAVAGVTSPFTAASTLRIGVQAGSINGLSSPTWVNCTITNAGESAVIRITRAADMDYVMLFANPLGNTAVGKENFIGRVLMANVAVGSTVDVRLNHIIIPGLEPVVFMPADDGARVKMATLGNLINKTNLGQLGLYTSTVYSSYFCFVITAPRAFGILDNPKSKVRV